MFFSLSRKQCRKGEIILENKKNIFAGAYGWLKTRHRTRHVSQTVALPATLSLLLDQCCGMRHVNLSFQKRRDEGIDSPGNVSTVAHVSLRITRAQVSLTHIAD